MHGIDRRGLLRAAAGLAGAGLVAAFPAHGMRQREAAGLRYSAIGDGHPLVFLHGWTMDHRDELGDYEPVFRRVPGWRRLYPDLPGMGRTPASAEIRDQDGMLAAVLGFIDATVGDAPFAIAGTSAGGYLARGVAARRPQQLTGMLLRMPLVKPADAERDVTAPQPLLRDTALMAGLDQDERALVGEPIVQRPGYLRALLRKQRTRVAPAQALADRAFLDPIRTDPARYALSFDPDARGHDAPSLVIAGRQDGSVGYRDALRLVERYPRASFAVLDRAEHGFPIEQRRLFEALVEDWLARVAEVAPHQAA